MRLKIDRVSRFRILRRQLSLQRGKLESHINGELQVQVDLIVQDFGIGRFSSRGLSLILVLQLRLLKLVMLIFQKKKSEFEILCIGMNSQVRRDIIQSIILRWSLGSRIRRMGNGMWKQLALQLINEFWISMDKRLLRAEFDIEWERLLDIVILGVHRIICSWLSIRLLVIGSSLLHRLVKFLQIQRRSWWLNFILYKKKKREIWFLFFIIPKLCIELKLLVFESPQQYIF